MTYEHWNSESSLPPVDCPLVIWVDPPPRANPVMPWSVVRVGGAVPAVRTGFLDDKTRDMEYRLADGSTITGRFRWTYP